jgi:hypothetical protein
MAGRWTPWIAAALGIGFALALAPPALLVWNRVRPQPWDSRSFRVRFESVRYERAGLVFTYLLQNRTRRSARLLPELTIIRALQAADRPLAGYVSMFLPLDVPAHSSQHVEVRLELPSPREPLTSRRASEEQTARVLRHQLPDASDREAPVSPLPMRSPPAGRSPPDTELPNPYLVSPLNDLDGFELINQTKGVRILFPRGW